MQSYLIGTLTIANGAATSDVFEDPKVMAGLDSILIVCPAALTNAVKLETAEAAAAADANYRTVQQPAGTDIALAAGKAVLIMDPAFVSIRVKAAGNELAERKFYLIGRVCQ